MVPKLSITPNPRLQRTRSAPLRSPLSRKPLGRLWLLERGRRLAFTRVAFIAGIAIVALRAGAQPLPGPRRPLTVCELVLRDVAAGGEFVSVRGEVVSGYETFALSSGACQTDNRAGALIWLEESPSDNFFSYARDVPFQGFFKAQRDRTVEQFVSSLEFVSPKPVVFRSDANWRKLQNELGRHGAALVTVFGRLDHEEKPRLVKKPDGSLELWARYGHLNGFSRRIVIERVEDVGRVRK